MILQRYSKTRPGNQTSAPVSKLATSYVISPHVSREWTESLARGCTQCIAWYFVGQKDLAFGESLTASISPKETILIQPYRKNEDYTISFKPSLPEGHQRQTSRFACNRSGRLHVSSVSVYEHYFIGREASTRTLHPHRAMISRPVHLRIRR